MPGSPDSWHSSFSFASWAGELSSIFFCLPSLTPSPPSCRRVTRTIACFFAHHLHPHPSHPSSPLPVRRRMAQGERLLPHVSRLHSPGIGRATDPSVLSLRHHQRRSARQLCQHQSEWRQHRKQPGRGGARNDPPPHHLSPLLSLLGNSHPPGHPAPGGQSCRRKGIAAAPPGATAATTVAEVYGGSSRVTVDHLLQQSV